MQLQDGALCTLGHSLCAMQPWLGAWQCWLRTSDPPSVQSTAWTQSRHCSAGSDALLVSILHLLWCRKCAVPYCGLASQPCCQAGNLMDHPAKWGAPTLKRDFMLLAYSGLTLMPFVHTPSAMTRLLPAVACRAKAVRRAAAWPLSAARSAALAVALPGGLPVTTCQISL